MQQSCSTQEHCKTASKLLFKYHHDKHEIHAAAVASVCNVRTGQDNTTHFTWLLLSLLCLLGTLQRPTAGPDCALGLWWCPCLLPARRPPGQTPSQGLFGRAVGAELRLMKWGGVQCRGQLLCGPCLAAGRLPAMAAFRECAQTCMCLDPKPYFCFRRRSLRCCMHLTQLHRWLIEHNSHCLCAVGSVWL